MVPTTNLVVSLRPLLDQLDTYTLAQRIMFEYGIRDIIDYSVRAIPNHYEVPNNVNYVIVQIFTHGEYTKYEKEALTFIIKEIYMWLSTSLINLKLYSHDMKPIFHTYAIQSDAIVFSINEASE